MHLNVDYRKLLHGDVWPPNLTSYPAIKRHADHYELVQDLPGIEEKDIYITAEDYVLTIAAKTETEYYKRSYKKSYTIPQEIDQEKIYAKYANGVLVLTLPIKESELPKQIKINVN